MKDLYYGVTKHFINHNWFGSLNCDTIFAHILFASKLSFIEALEYALLRCPSFYKTSIKVGEVSMFIKTRYTARHKNPIIPIIRSNVSIKRPNLKSHNAK